MELIKLKLLDTDGMTLLTAPAEWTNTPPPPPGRSALFT